jgi:succinate dehydrogenase/fumarate reductase flavoprotein subunit
VDADIDPEETEGSEALWPHILLDRAKPGLIAVNSAGRRFVNESDSYHDVVMGMLRSQETVPSVPAHLICDAAFLRSYGLGLALPGARGRRRLVKAGYLIEAPDLLTLASRIGVDAAELQRTVQRHNEFAATGIDEDFGRGTSPMNRFNGDPANTPNPCMRPIVTAPYYAVAVWPADLAGSAGLKGDIDGRVLDESGAPIPGLFACGNDLTSIFRGTYPGPGTTIGPAMVFGWRIAKAAAKAANPLPEAFKGHISAMKSPHSPRRWAPPPRPRPPSSISPVHPRQRADFWACGRPTSAPQPGHRPARL